MKHTGTKLVESERLYLRPFMYSDCSDMLKYWISNPKVKNGYGEPFYATEAEVIQLLEQWITQYPNIAFYRWAIIKKHVSINIGQIAFCKVYSDVEAAEIEYCIGECFWGNGYADEALAAIIGYTFEHTGFLKLEAFHRKENIRSGRVLEKSAMQVTGTVRRFELLDQIPRGETCYAITKDEYFANV